MNRILALFLITFILFANSCANAPHRSSAPHYDAQKVELEINFYVGSAMSRKVRQNATYDSMEIRISERTDKKTDRIFGKRLNRVSVNASSAQRICEIIDAAKPWLWQSSEMEAIANNLYFHGKCGGKSWNYESIYPDKRLEAVLLQLRRELKLN